MFDRTIHVGVKIVNRIAAFLPKVLCPLRDVPCNDALVTKRIDPLSPPTRGVTQLLQSNIKARPGSAHNASRVPSPVRIFLNIDEGLTDALRNCRIHFNPSWSVWDGRYRTPEKRILNRCRISGID